MEWHRAGTASQKAELREMLGKIEHGQSYAVDN